MSTNNSAGIRFTVPVKPWIILVTAGPAGATWAPAQILDIDRMTDQIRGRNLVPMLSWFRREVVVRCLFAFRVAGEADPGSARVVMPWS